jgi:hypothetical protein
MERRRFINRISGLTLTLHPLGRGLDKYVFGLKTNASDLGLNGPLKPVFIYNNWSAYDELSDHVALTEELAMRELREIIRLKTNGVEIDYYVMDAFWFDKWGGYRTWHKEHWPHGPDHWLNECRANDIKPGMWFSTNLIATQSGRFLEPIPEWADSLGTDPNIMCLFEGGYLNHLSGSLQLWYEKGVRLFKFDFAYFEAVTPASKDKYTKEEILEKNKVAFMRMLQDFRSRNQDVLITGYNGFGGDMENTFTPFNKKIDPRWLDCFDTLYCGDPRFSDVPMMNIWRSQDNYSDHQVFAFQAYGLPIRRIDNCAFMIGTTGTCYYRGTHCWKGMLILELARGGWVNVYHGNLELLNDADGQWFARVQNLYRELQSQDQISSFGEIPGKGQPYGFKASGKKGSVYAVVNPSQEMSALTLPESQSPYRILYSDGGYIPRVKGNRIYLGAEQLAVVGDLQYAAKEYDLGIDESISIPRTITRLDATFRHADKNRMETRISVPIGMHLRILLQQFDANGLPHRSWGGSPPSGKKMDAFLKIRVSQDGQYLPLHMEYDKVIWSGLSWAAVELRSENINQAKPLEISCESTEPVNLRLEARLYAITY